MKKITLLQEIERHGDMTSYIYYGISFTKMEKIHDNFQKCS